MGTPDIPELNGCAECRWFLSDGTQLSACVLGRSLFDNDKLPKIVDNLVAKAMNWTFDSLDITATTAHPHNKSAQEMWYDKSAKR